jgi:hypothetical protein
MMTRKANSRPAFRPAMPTGMSLEELDLLAQKIQVWSLTTRGSLGLLCGQIPVYQGNNREFCGIGCLVGSLLHQKMPALQGFGRNSL